MAKKRVCGNCSWNGKEGINPCLASLPHMGPGFVGVWPTTRSTQAACRLWNAPFMVDKKEVK
jgi:hypothetical protein